MTTTLATRHAVVAQPCDGCDGFDRAPKGCGCDGSGSRYYCQRCGTKVRSEFGHVRCPSTADAL